MQETRYPTVSIQSRLKRVKLVRMTPERGPAPEHESTVALPLPVPQQPTWHTFLGTPLVKGALGLLIGLGLLVAASRFVDLPTTLHLMQQRLTTPQGVLFALFASLALVLAFSIRALRWKVLLNPVGKVRALTVLQLFLIGVFLNFLLPIRAGELAKSLILKRKTGLPLSHSLPTITMDKAFDLLPALFVSAVVPLVGAHLDLKLWSVLVLANGCLLGLFLFVLLAAWKRPLALGLLQRGTGMLPRAFGSKLEGFLTGFVDALLLSAKNPRVLLSAVLLTGVAVTCDGLYNYFAFWTIGYHITFGEALVGYLLFNLFYLLPSPPGQVGSNEVVALLIFTGLLHLAPEKVIAMAVFFHPWSGLLMCVMGMACLSALGVRFSQTLTLQTATHRSTPRTPPSRHQ
jgi:uncharacterized protein (TIRG00374 family)